MVRICPVCQQEVKPVQVDWPDGTKRWMPVACQCQIKDYEEGLKRSEDNMRRKKIQKQFSLSSVGKNLENATFQNFEQTIGSQTALKESVEFVKNFKQRLESGEGLLIYGHSGNGKSHLSAAIARSVSAKSYLVVYQSVPAFLARMKQGYGDEAPALLEAITYADLVILDDIGAGVWTKMERGYFEEIMECLNFNKKLLMATTNIDQTNEDNAKALLGERSYDRLIGKCRIVENKAPSYRRKIAVERANRGGVKS